MEVLYYLSAICLILFMFLATYDGFYLHIWKYELFNKKESINEHKIHAIRSVLFPLILWLFFINNDLVSFYIGLLFVVIDVIVLAMDAYLEEDSRKSMGGLPKWEYILHLFANAFHFAAILLMLGAKIRITEFGIFLTETSIPSFGYELINFISVNIIPGSIILALVHVFLILPKGIGIWNKNRKKIKCC